MKKEIQTMIENSLSSVMPLLILRGNDALARAEGDIDVLVPSGQALIACRVFAGAARQAGWYLLFFRDIGYLAQVVLCRPSSDGNYFTIKVDFFSGVEWYGVGGGDLTKRLFAEVMVSARTNEERRVIAAAINFFQKSMTVGHLSGRDMARALAGGATPELIVDVAARLKLPVSFQEALSGHFTWLNKWRLRSASASPRNIWLRISWIVRIVLVHLKYKSQLGSKSGLVIAVSGLDGSGKSTQLEQLLRAYKDGGDLPVATIHMLPRWIPLPHQIIHRKATVQNYTRPYSEPPTASSISAAIRLIYYLLAFLVTKALLWFTATRGSVSVMDRWFADFAADLSRARIPYQKLPDIILKACVPSGCMLFIDVKPESAVKRKGELTLDNAYELRNKYRKIFKQVKGRVVDGEGSPSEVFSRVLSCIDSIYRSRLDGIIASRKHLPKLSSSDSGGKDG